MFYIASVVQIYCLQSKQNQPFLYTTVILYNLSAGFRGQNVSEICDGIFNPPFYYGLTELLLPGNMQPHTFNNNKALLPYSTCKNYMINWNVVWR